jgi:hypothetical protein
MQFDYGGIPNTVALGIQTKSRLEKAVLRLTGMKGLKRGLNQVKLEEAMPVWKLARD